VNSAGLNLFALTLDKFDYAVCFDITAQKMAKVSDRIGLPTISAIGANGDKVVPMSI
jgi:hypothetical protein